MAYQIVDTDALMADAWAFDDWAQQLFALWTQNRPELTWLDSGYATSGHEAFGNQYGQAFAALGEFLVGGLWLNDSWAPTDAGGTGGCAALEAFNKALWASIYAYNDTDDQVRSLMIKYGIS
ncbi:MAG: hypothetical protein FWF75_02170 [Propionibacteriaceae bacterium]|nr:hypothetical protein [Propionibacteriaceae bacterium]